MAGSSSSVKAADKHQPADALSRSWVYRLAPPALWPYLQLMRADRPIGAYLLFWPCIWGLGLAFTAQTFEIGLFSLYSLLFAVGAYVMRGAGCVWNDLMDRDIDAKVARTSLRPLVSGAVTPKQAILFMACLALTGFVVILMLNRFTLILALASLPLIAIYPLMKRITYFPQIVLGLAFNWGALVGWSALRGDLTLSPLLIYLAGLFWTLGYDTIYAHQDKEDDALIGVKSTALKFGKKTKPFISVFYGLVILLTALAMRLEGAGLAGFLALSLAAAHFIWQIITLDIDNPDRCLNLFRANHTSGALLALAIALGSL